MVFRTNQIDLSLIIHVLTFLLLIFQPYVEFKVGKCELIIYTELIESRADMGFGLGCSEYSQSTRLPVVEWDYIGSEALYLML